MEESRRSIVNGWTPEEIDRLALLAKKRASAAEIARLLGRRVVSVRREAAQLGLLLYKRPRETGKSSRGTLRTIAKAPSKRSRGPRGKRPLNPRTIVERMTRQEDTDYQAHLELAMKMTAATTGSERLTWVRIAQAWHYLGAARAASGAACA